MGMRWPVMVVLVAAIASACGGAGGPRGPRPGTPMVLEIESDGRLDGFVRNDGQAFVHGDGPGVGDLDQARQGLAFRMFYAFPLDELPPA